MQTLDRTTYRKCVIDALRSTGSSDPDVLHARKDELLAEIAGHRRTALAQIASGAALSLTGIGSPAGVRLIRHGLAGMRQVRSSRETVEATFDEYMAANRTTPLQRQS